MRSRFLIAAIGVLATGWLGQLQSARAQVRGDSKVLALDGKAGLGAQNILVIPVVDSNFAYNASTRQIETGFPGDRQTILDDYARMSAFWAEASYGIVSLAATVPNCYYQVPFEFPNAGEEPYQEAKVTGAQGFFFGVAYSRIVVDYVVDPAQPPLKKVFTSDPNVTFETVEDLLLSFNAQVPDTEAIEAAFDGEPSFLSGKLVFRIKAAMSQPGSTVTINIAESDVASRRALRLVRPTVTTNTTTGQIVMRSEGAYVPGRVPSDTGSLLRMDFKSADGSLGIYQWNLTNPDGTPLTNCFSASTCPTYANAAELSLIMRPGAGSVGQVRDTTVDGYPELEFDLVVSSTGVPFDSLNVVPERFGTTLGLSSIQTQVGKGVGRADTPQGAGVLTTAALQALLNTELGSDLGCLAPELMNLTGADANTKQVLDDFLASFDGIHALLLTDTNTALRANATLDPTALDMSLTIGASSFSYQVLADISAVNLVSGAATIAHEVGHNIGFPDLYDVSTTYPDFVTDFHPNLTWMGGWDMMASHGAFPHPGAYTKQSFHQWVSGAGDNGTVKTIMPGTDATYLVTPLEFRRADYDVNIPSGPNGEEVVKMLILPFGDEPPAPGRSVPPHFIAVENRQQSTSMSATAFNKSLPGGGGIHVTDNLSDLRFQGADFKPINRQHSHSLVEGPPYPDAGGPPVTLGSTLDTTATFPAYPGMTINPIMTVPAPDPSLPPSVLVRVAYTTTERLDLKIEPWNAPTEYATKSIWFERATSAVPPVNPPLPSEVGNVAIPLYRDGYDPAANGGVPLNWIHVYVENPGTFDAEDVQLKAWFNSPGGIGDPEQWQELEITAGKAIPAKGSAVFSIPWSPGVDVGTNGHTCIAVEVHNWKVGAFGQVADINPFNNLSQENVHKMEMISASPWHGVPFKVEVHNSFADPVTVRLEPQGLLPGYSVALDQPSVLMSGKSSQVFTGTLNWDSEIIPTPTTQNPYDPYWQACNVTATAGVNTPSYCGGTWSLTAYADLGDARVPLGGVSFETEGKPTATVTSSATSSANGDIVVTGQVLPPYRGQTVRVVVKYPSGRHDTVEIPTLSGGTFALPFTPKERGPIVITTELPRGTWPSAPFAPTDPVEIAVDACVPGSGTPPPSSTCTDGVQNGTETGVDCGGLSCQPCSATGVTAQLVMEADWGTGYCAVVKVNNHSALATTNWYVTLNTLQSTMYATWNGQFSGTSGNVQVASLSWNGVIQPGSSVVSTGFCADRASGSTATATVISAGAGF